MNFSRRTLLRAVPAGAALASLGWNGAVHANPVDALEAFLRSARSGRADFTQVVTAPARDGQTPRSKSSAGTFEFLRPGRFRFVYKTPFEQTIVADGETLWLHDVDLNQVTARAQARVLGSTPAALIAAAPDLKALRKEFELDAAPEQGGLQWVQATPRTRDGQLASARVGFKGADLAALEILDSFGQRSLMSFVRMEVNVPLAPAAFQFKPPAGADIVRS